jgi:hypothetical protein
LMHFILNILLTWAQLHFDGASLDDVRITRRA